MKPKPYETEVRLYALRCLRCNESWVPRDPMKLPVACAKCGSPYWKTLPKQTGKAA